MTRAEFRDALRAARRVFVQVPCTGNRAAVERGAADDCQIFQISKSEARRVLITEGDPDSHVIALVHGDALYIG